LHIPFGDEADVIVVDQRAIRYQEHLANLGAAYQQWADLEHQLSATRMTRSEFLAATAGRDEALRAITAESEAALAYHPCQCPHVPMPYSGTGTGTTSTGTAVLRPSTEDGVL